MNARVGPSRLLPLGTGSILMRGGRSASSYLLEVGGQRTLFDIGPGALLRLQEAGIDAMSIDRVVLSHFHPDHHADLLALLFLRANPAHTEKAPCVLHAPTGLRRILAAWSSVYGDWVAHPDEDIVEMEVGAHRVGVLEVEAHRAAHTMPAYCYRIEAPCGLRLAYSGDTDACAGLEEACRDVDLAWIECSFPDEEAVEGHLTPSRIRTLAERARPRRVALTHFYPAMFPLLESREKLDSCFRGLESEILVLHDLEALDLDKMRRGS